MTETQTPLSAFLQLADEDPSVPVVIDKRRGRWQPRTREALVDDVVALAGSLATLGIDRDTVVLNATSDRFDWLAIDLAVQSLGARICPVPVDATDELITRSFALSGATVVVAPGQGFVDRLLGLEEAGRLPTVDRLIYQDPAGLAEYQDERLVALDDLRAANLDDEDRRRWRAAVEGLSPSDPAVVSISAGVEGEPRASVLTRGALYAATRAVIDTFDLGTQDRLLAYRPLSDPSERTTTIYAALLSGALLALAETRADVRAAMYEIAPTFLHLTPRFIDTVLTEVTVRLESARGVKGAVTRWWLRSNRDEDPRPPGVTDRVLITYPVLEKLGLDKARAVLVSGSEVSPGLRRRAVTLGLPLRTAFATSAVGGVVTVSEPGDLHPGACGRPLPGFELTVGDASELSIAGAGVSDAVQTGDAARLEDGELRLGGRLSERLTFDDGSSVSLLEVESALRSSPYIREAVIAGRPGGEPTIVVELAEGPTARWASRQGLAFVTYRSLVALPEVAELARSEVDDSLASTPLGRVDDVRVLPAQLESLPGTLLVGDKIRRDGVIAATTDASAVTSSAG